MTDVDPLDLLATIREGLHSLAVRKPKAAKPVLTGQDDAFTTSSGDAWTGRA